MCHCLYLYEPAPAGESIYSFYVIEINHWAIGFNQLVCASREQARLLQVLLQVSDMLYELALAGELTNRAQVRNSYNV